MVDCKICAHPYCEHAGTQRGIVVSCNGYIEPKKPQTNADRIRAMSDEELAACLLFMGTVCECCAKSPECNEVPGYYKCNEGIRDWLRQPVKDGDNE